MRILTNAIVGLIVLSIPAIAQEPVGTARLVGEHDFASDMVAGIDRYLLKKTQQVGDTRPLLWNRDYSSAEAYDASIAPHRQRLRAMLGVVDERMAFDAPEILTPVGQDGPVAIGDGYRVYEIRWPVLAGPAPTNQNLPSITGEGLLLVPDSQPLGNVIALPDADQSPEQICGLADGVFAESQFARRAAESGCLVVVPTLISRARSKRNGRANLTNREYLHRSAFELGRHLAGYEVQKVLALVDWFDAGSPTRRIGVIGYGEGGYLATFAAAIDPRIDATCVSGALGRLDNTWQWPLDRNVFGLLPEFGGGQLAAMIPPRRLIADITNWPHVNLSGDGGAPGSLKATGNSVREELDVAASVAAHLTSTNISNAGITAVFAEAERFCSGDGLAAFLTSVCDGKRDVGSIDESAFAPRLPDDTDRGQRIQQRHQRQFEQIDRHNQALLTESSFVRKQFVNKLDTASLEAFAKSAEAYRKIFREEIIGEFDDRLLPFNARSRQSWETEDWTGHEVVLDVFDDVIAYGVLLLPKDLKPGERRPVVVCQHGLEGRPTDTFLNDHRAYHDFAAKLCERGFVVFAPQNPYIFEDRFRTLQRKANPLGKTLFSIIVPQHQQIVNWLKSQPYVDSDRIGFYGLSYGGKSAMRIPALVTDYCLSICSADFNEWVLKNASTREKFSYVWTGEYEIFEWNLGGTFNYFEMAALICPRPFMVERGHFDGVGEDHWVAHEYAKVRHLYSARLGIGDRTEIEWFVGPHTINGQGTFAFLHKHLNWPEGKTAEKNRSE